MLQIINTGVANIRSLQATFDRLNQPWNLTEDADQIADADQVVLPGVGAFAAAMDQLNRLGLTEAVVDRINNDRSTLAICMGFQLLCESSEESPGVQGLGVLPLKIQRFHGDAFVDHQLKIPQLGWNKVTPRSDGGLVTPGVAYFANSFRLAESPPDDWSFAETDYGGSFVSSFWRGRVLGCQFHPELSGPWGQSVLQNWIAGGNS